MKILSSDIIRIVSAISYTRSNKIWIYSIVYYNLGKIFFGGYMESNESNETTESIAAFKNRMEALMQSRPMYYDMDTKPIYFPEEWARYRGDLSRDGSKTLAHDVIGKYRIITVYVGIDMGMFNAAPLIFETMIFVESDRDDPLDIMWMDRYTYKDQAMDGHQHAVRLVRGEISLDEAGGC